MALFAHQTSFSVSTAMVSKKASPFLGEATVSKLEFKGRLHQDCYGASPTVKEKFKEIVLTPRELSILRLMADDLADKQIADELGIHVHTVRFHIKNALRKAGKRGRAGLMWHLRDCPLLAGSHAGEPERKLHAV